MFKNRKMNEEAIEIRKISEWIDAGWVKGFTRSVRMGFDRWRGSSV